MNYIIANNAVRGDKSVEPNKHWPLGEDTLQNQIPEGLRVISREHDYVLRLLPLLESEATRILKKGKQDYRCMRDIMHYLVNVTDVYHHPKEELIFDRMSDLTPATSDAVSQLRRQHDELEVQGKSILQKVSEKKESSARAKKLSYEVLAYSKSLQEHIKLEESQVLRVAYELLCESDWHEIDEEIGAVADPLFGHAIDEFYLELMQQYLDRFVSVSDSGGVPVQLFESLAGNLERAISTTVDVGVFQKELFSTAWEIGRSRLRHLSQLSKVRSPSGMAAWGREALVGEWQGWKQMQTQFAHGFRAIHYPTTEATHSDEGATIKLRTEKEFRNYQAQPFKSEPNPRISWQAASMNLFTRFTVKQLMRYGNLTERNKPSYLSRPSNLVPEGTYLEKVDETDFNAEWIVPISGATGERTIVYLPGGGFIAPATAMHRRLVGKFACETNTRVLLVNYRLLPDHPFPAGLDDALAAYRFLLDGGVPPEEIVLAGDSAGGNLVLSLMNAARDQGLPLPLASVLMSALTDLTFSSKTWKSNRWKDPFLPLMKGVDSYQQYADDTPVDDPLVSPLYGNFKGFPDMLALVSSTETLLDDTLSVARKARADGVDVEVEVWANLPHAWPIFPFIPEADAAASRIVAFIDQKFGQNRSFN